MRCNCGINAKIGTSWTDNNPGRRFMACSRWPGAEACRYFEWHDPEMCRRSRAIIPGLLRKMNEKEAENKRLRKRQWRMGLMIIVLGLLWVRSWMV